MSTREQLGTVLADLAGVLDAIDPAQADDPTPCTDYSVADLRGHVVGWLTAFTDGFAAPDGACSDPDAVTIDGTGGDQVRGLAARMDEALASGALERPLMIGGAGLPGDMAAAMILWEYQMHGWDLASATGQPWHPDEDGLEASLAFAPAMLTPDYQGVGKSFGPAIPVPADAPPLDRLLGLSGRDPAWRRPGA